MWLCQDLGSPNMRYIVWGLSTLSVCNHSYCCALPILGSIDNQPPAPLAKRHCHIRSQLMIFRRCILRQVHENLCQATTSKSRSKESPLPWVLSVVLHGPTITILPCGFFQFVVPPSSFWCRAYPDLLCSSSNPSWCFYMHADMFDILLVVLHLSVSTYIVVGSHSVSTRCRYPKIGVEGAKVRRAKWLLQKKFLTMISWRVIFSPRYQIPSFGE